MNSFISNFRREFRVIACVLAVCLVAELSVRALQTKLSADVVHIREIPSIARKMGESKSLRVLFLGNSLTRRGVNLHLIRDEVEPERKPAVWFDKVNPDDTAILDWYYLFRRYFVGSRAPDYVVLGWVENQLGDASHVHPDRIAAYYGGWSNAGEMFRYDLYDNGLRMDYLLSTVFTSFAEKDRIRTRLLALAVPDYRDTAERFNAAVVAKGKPPKKAAQTYTRLQRFLLLCKQRQVRVIAAAMPLPQPYPLDDSLAEVLNRNGATLLDLRQVRGIGVEDYADGYHLAPRGADLYSKKLGEDLDALLAGRNLTAERRY